MIDSFFNALELINDFLWGHIGFILIMGLGGYFTIRSRFYQLRKFFPIIGSFFTYAKEKVEKNSVAVHPLKVFFAAIGGCIGIGNVVGICTAVQIGGPGAIFWTWIAGLVGMLIQYGEVFLGMKYRIKNDKGGYDGGPMYFLPRAYKKPWIAGVFCFLLCLYGVEIFMFNVMADSITVNWYINKYLVVFVLLAATLYAVSGGIKRVGEICAAIIPLFIILYVGMAFWVIFKNLSIIPTIFSEIFKGAFTEQAAWGAFAGSSVLLTISMGLSRGAYSGDIGIGYTSIIYSETSSQDPERQAWLTILGVFLDTFVICSLSIFLVLITRTWHTGIDVALMVQVALGEYFPYMQFFMPFFLLLLGWTTIISYLAVGLKCAHYLSPKYGKIIYYIYAALTLPLFAFVNPNQAFVIMSISGAMLLLLNLVGMFLLRKEVLFDTHKMPKQQP